MQSSQCQNRDDAKNINPNFRSPYANRVALTPVNKPTHVGNPRGSKAIDGSGRSTQLTYSSVRRPRACKRHVHGGARSVLRDRKKNPAKRRTAWQSKEPPSCTQSSETSLASPEKIVGRREVVTERLRALTLNRVYVTGLSGEI